MDQLLNLKRQLIEQSHASQGSMGCLKFIADIVTIKDGVKEETGLHDVPVASEMLGLLDYVLANHDIRISTDEHFVLPNQSCVLVSDKYLLACMVCEHDELKHITHWISGTLKNSVLLKPEGTLIIPFIRNFEFKDSQQNSFELALLPDWFCMYIPSNDLRCIPLLCATRSFSASTGIELDEAMATERFKDFYGAIVNPNPNDETCL